MRSIPAIPIADRSPPIVVGIDRRGDQANEKRHQYEYVLWSTGIDSKRLEGHNSEQKDDRETSQQNIERNLVRGLLTRSPLNELDHAVEERFPGIRGNAHLDFIRKNPRSTSNRRTISAGFADDRRRLARDRRLVDRRHTFDDLAVSRNEVANGDDDDVSGAQFRTGHDLHAAVTLQTVGLGFRSRFAQGVGLRLAPALGHRFREIGKENRKPQPKRDL
jgi:hypothetical protein